MQRGPQDITLGANTWSVRPLTLAQVRDIEPVLAAQAAGATVASAMQVIAVALARDNPTAVEALPETEATAPEIGRALAIVLRLGGFIAEDVPAGEASADAGARASA